MTLISICFLKVSQKWIFYSGVSTGFLYEAQIHFTCQKEQKHTLLGRQYPCIYFIISILKFFDKTKTVDWPLQHLKYYVSICLPKYSTKKPKLHKNQLLLQ